MWSHDEQRELNDVYANIAMVRCPHCNGLQDKYVKSHYTGGSPCVLLVRFCRYCKKSLEK